MPNVDLHNIPQGVKQKSGSKPTSTVTASEAERQAAQSENKETTEPDVDTKASSCSLENDDVKNEVSLEDLNNMDNNINSGGILPLNVDNKVINSGNSSDYTDMDAVD